MQGFCGSPVAAGGRAARQICVCSARESAVSRRDVLFGAIGGAIALAGQADVAYALVKGSTPPPDFAKRDTRERAKNVEEARQIGEGREQEMFGDEKEFQVAKSGDRYVDLKPGTGKEIATGSDVDVRYRVLKAGKRSLDGLTGEGSLIFSYGYGEDDDKEGDILHLSVGDGKNVVALNEAIIGMREGGIRRIRVLPERGWRKLDGCEKNIDVGTAVGLPGASLTEMESCMDPTRFPSPLTFQGKRKLSRRFDGTLVLEVEAVKVN